ncbi:DNA adenine methylase [bacterium]|nr:DNA adenine methylase [bacterium]
MLNATEINSLKPLIKWAGGKRALISTLKPLIPKSFNRYCEPFIGGGALFWELAIENSIISDSNEELINFYKVVRDRPQKLFKIVSSMVVSEEEYYKIRSSSPQSLNNTLRAARFIYLNKTCYNGLYRVNRKNQFNTPFGKKTDVNIIDKARLFHSSELLKQTNILCGDYNQSLNLLSENDFVYLDPPYLAISKYSDFNRYTKNFFAYEDQVVLSEKFKQLSGKGVLALMSNSFNEKLLSLYKDFHIKEVYARRQINSKSKDRGKIKELIIANYPIE